jgi:hypothetical protein
LPAASVPVRDNSKSLESLDSRRNTGGVPATASPKNWTSAICIELAVASFFTPVKTNL